MSLWRIGDHIMINIDKVPGEGIGAANAIPDLEVVEFWNRVLNEDLSGVLINSPYFLPDTNKIFIERISYRCWVVNGPPFEEKNG